MSKKISLCMIVGNVEEYIRRCLTSFAPIADEICIVRAIGNAKPDATLDIAAKEFGAKVGEYNNKKIWHPTPLGEQGTVGGDAGWFEDHTTWPHVDNFAAARQQSFDMATGEYCFWCDSDDVLEEGGEFIREHAERGGYPLFLFPYKIFGRGVSLPRERMMIRGGGKWKFPVHECYTFPIAVEGVQDDRVVVTHLPHLTKGGSNERNLRILEAIPESDMTAGLYYHLYGALGSAGRINEAIAAAKKAINHPEIGAPEKYELFMDLARMAGDNEKTRIAFLHSAYQADPKRREALGLLACASLDYGRPADAMVYARQMIATPKPAGESWNDRNAAYGWLGNEIYTQALRANGDYATAEEIRLKTLADAGGPTIALVHATRGRPQQASIARKQWIDLAAEPDRIEHIFVFDTDDESSRPLRRMHHLEITSGGGCVAAWNNGALATTAPIIVQLSDDWTPFPQWDKAIVERIGDVNKPVVLAISDGSRRDDLLCMAICTRKYFEQDYFLFHPWFTGVYSDNWFTEEAKRRGAIIDAKDLVFSHNHPAFGKSEVDQTYQEQNAPERYAHGKDILEELQKREDWSTVPGFFNYWTFYQAIANRLKTGDTVAEVGVWLGRSLIYLAQECKRQGKQIKFIAVDTFQGEHMQPNHVDVVTAYGGNFRAQFESNLKRCGVADCVTIIEGDSAAGAVGIADQSIDFCYIDAAHDYESVKRDLLAWKPKVKPVGMIAGHDAQHEPVMNAVNDIIGEVKTLGCVWLA